MNKKNTSRLITLSLIYLAYMLLFIDRSVLNISLAYIGKDFHLSPTALGSLASAFFFSYSLMQIPGGWLVDKLGSKKMVAFTLGLWSLLTIATGLAWSLLSLLIIRFAFGLAEGPYPAAALKQISETYPKSKRSQATSITLSSNYAGATIAPFLITFAIGQWSWRGAFFALGLLGLLILGSYCYYERPFSQTVSTSSAPKQKLSLKQADSKIISFIIIGLSLNVVTKGLDTWMPTYLLAKRHLNLKNIAWLVPLPTIAGGIAALISGFLLVHLFKNQAKLLIALSTLGTLIFMFGMYQATALTWVIVCEVLTFFFKALAFTSCFAYIAQTPNLKNYGASIGLVNFGGQLGGFLAPIMIGAVVQLSGGSFTAAFFCLVLWALLAFISSFFIKN